MCVAVDDDMFGKEEWRNVEEQERKRKEEEGAGEEDEEGHRPRHKIVSDKPSQKEIDEQRASIPLGQLCEEVETECVFNASLLCDVQCAAEVEYYQKLCIVKEQRNASFDYNISQCRHPDGWMVGEPKYKWYRRQNESDPLGAVPEKIRRAPHWSYDDVEDHTILNCTCHFRNGTYDPRFVAFMLLSDMRPYRTHFVSVCSCLFNATLGEPEHCIQSNHTFAEQELDRLLNPPKKGDAVVLDDKEVLVEEFRDDFLTVRSRSP